MKLTLDEIAAHVKGKVIGNPKKSISGVSEIQNSIANTITFLGNPLYKKYLASTKADAVLVTDAALLKGKNGIVVNNPQLVMAKTLELFFPNAKNIKGSVAPSAVISKHALIGENVKIEDGCVIKDRVKIGDNSIIGPNSTILENTVLGNDCKIFSNVSIYNNITLGNNVIIHSGTVVGSDGFGYVTTRNMHHKIPQTGDIIIGNNVEIGANCAIDRATIGSTIIKEMTKIDNLAHIAHNVTIGKGCLITAGFAIAGSSCIGDFCTFGGQVGIAPHLQIGDGAIVAGKSGVTKSLKGNRVYSGIPAREIKDYNKRMALVNQVEKLRRQLDGLIKS